MVVLGTGKTYLQLCRKSSMTDVVRILNSSLTIFHYSSVCIVMSLDTEEEEEASLITICLW